MLAVIMFVFFGLSSFLTKKQVFGGFMITVNIFTKLQLCHFIIFQISDLTGNNAE